METISRHLEELTAFHQVALQKSFTRAAEELSTSKALLSKQVKRLEVLLKTQLFVRTTRSLKLTSEGEELYRYSLKILTLSDEATRRIRDLGESDDIPIRISMPVSLGEVFAPSFLADNAKRFKNVRFEFDLSNENRDFMKDQVDFALRADDDHDPDLVARYLGRMRDAVCVETTLKSAIGALKDPAQLAELPCITHSREAAWNVWTFSSHKQDHRVQVRGPISTNQYGAVLSLCLAGQGIARLPAYFVREHLRQKKLVECFSEYLIATHPVYLVYPKRDYRSRRHREVKEAILEWFQSRPKEFVP